MTTKRIIWTNPDGTVSVLVPAPGVPEHVWRKDIPQGVAVVETTAEALPRDRMFRKAWKLEGSSCFECPVKAKDAAHEIRRAKREQEFAPHDEAIAKRIPGAAVQAEAARQQIREKYDGVQQRIDLAQTPDELRAILNTV